MKEKYPGQKELALREDTVPAMLTEGEAVIPAPAAQDPKNKPLIDRMIEEGRIANAKFKSGIKYVNQGSSYIDNDGIEWHWMGPTQTQIPPMQYENGTKYSGITNTFKNLLGSDDNNNVYYKKNSDGTVSKFINKSKSAQTYIGKDADQSGEWNLSRLNPFNQGSDYTADKSITMMSAPLMGKNQRETVKLMMDERRKEEKHQLDMQLKNESHLARIKSL